MFENQNNNFFEGQGNPNLSRNHNRFINSNVSAKAFNINNNFRKNLENITFCIDFSTGQQFIFSDNPNNLFKLTLNKFLKEKRLESFRNTIQKILCNAKRVDLNKTLFENHIYQNSHVLFIITDKKIVNDYEKINAIGFRFYAKSTKAGKDQNGHQKQNQDISLIYLNIGNIRGFNLFGVLDGHGLHGHFVSKFCKDYFISQFNDFASQCINENYSTPELIYNKLKFSNFNFIRNCFNNADNAMTQQFQFEYNFSGTTCSLVIQLKAYLICANVGDSRSIIIYDNDTQTNQGIFSFSIDHIPDIPYESERIINNNGFVAKIKDKNGKKSHHKRVFKSGCNFPALSISRSLGDFIAKECGVINRPHITLYKINHNTKYLVISSKGIWKYLSNESVRDLGNIYYQKGQIGPFCSNLIEKAAQRRRINNDRKDDITVVCIYF